MHKNLLASIFLGTFNSELFWKDSALSSLPSCKDRHADLIVDAMDELQFVFCSKPDDLVVTRFPMNSAHKIYLESLGFNFLNNVFQLQDNEYTFDRSVCELLLENSKTEYFNKLFLPKKNFSPYSILPFSTALCSKYAINTLFPDCEIVKKVNSKFFSHELSKELYEDTAGKIINSAGELYISGCEFLQRSPFLIKDALGVSGNGNILINSESILINIVKYLTKQERKGKESKFLIEPLLNKERDFSCQFEINNEGIVKIISVQEMLNNGFVFSGIRTAGTSLLSCLENSKYFDYVEKVGKALYKEGYFGYVCLDSMMLDNKKIIPIIEINARKSMGLINYYIDQFLSRYSLYGNFISFALSIPWHLQYEDILNMMDQYNILFCEKRLNGIMPLCANTLYVNRKPSEKIKSERHKGRFYASIVANNQMECGLLLNQLKKLFFDMNIKMLS